jgi:hypothetical protein
MGNLTSSDWLVIHRLAVICASSLMTSFQSNLLNKSSIALHGSWSARVAMARAIVNNDLLYERMNRERLLMNVGMCMTN